jgi:hypothetical protein
LSLKYVKQAFKDSRRGSFMIFLSEVLRRLLWLQGFIVLFLFLFFAIFFLFLILFTD